MRKQKKPNENARLDLPEPVTSASSRERGKRRTWIYRVVTLLIIPAGILGLLELTLRISGYGYPTSYFIKCSIEGQDFLIPNEKFSYRVFPPALARRPPDYRIPASKPDGVYRIFVLGESAALGTPDWSYGVSRHLEVLLDARFPETDFEVFCVAMTAINSHLVLPISREVAGLDGDLWVIYMGNNEMIGPFGAGTVFGAKAPGLGFARTSLALKTTRLGQLMANSIATLSSSSRVPEQWKGISMFKKNLLRHDDPKRLRASENFAGNLEDILNTGRKAGVPVILSTLGSNLRDCSPFASLHRKNLDPSLKREWDRLFQAGLAHEKTGQYEAALNCYRDAVTIDSEFAELQFRMGTCQLAVGQPDQAEEAFILARDYDALAVRADTRINRILMGAITEDDDQVFLLNAAEDLAAQSPEGIPGRDLFFEHVHFTPEGNFTLARIVADQVRNLLPTETLNAQTDEWLEQNECHQRLALSVWDQWRLWEEQSHRVNAPPFISQTSNPSNKSHIDRQRKKTIARIADDTWTDDQQLYESALNRVPEDTFLINNYVQFLDGIGNSEKAIEQAERLCALLPGLSWPHYYLATLLKEAGRQEEARLMLQRTLVIRDDFTQARELLKQLQ